MTGFVPPKGREPLVSAEFWKPKAPGEAVLGRVVSYRPGRGDFPPTITLAPVLLWLKGAEKPDGYASLAVGLNSQLQRVITPEHIGSAIAIGYKGSKQTQGGPTPMRIFKVFPMDDELDNLIGLHAPDLASAKPSVGAGPGQEEGPPLDEEDDDLPF